ncbi:hypothetical protein ES702_02969 [subsurface metagenome]
MDLKSRKWYKKTIKKNKGIIGILFIISIFFGIIFMSTDIKAEGDYTPHLYNDALKILTDKVYIFQEKATDTNDYRNYFEIKDYDSEFQDYNLLSHRYADDAPQRGNLIKQTYLDNLDNLNAFRSQNKTNIVFNETISNFNIINGTKTQDGTLDLLDNDYTKIISDSDSEIQKNIVCNDNLTLHTLEAFPDNGNDGNGDWHYGQYTHTGSCYTEVDLTEIDENTIGKGRNIKLFDPGASDTRFHINFTSLQFGNLSFWLLMKATISKRWQMRFYNIDHDTRVFTQCGYGHMINNAWSNIFAGLGNPNTIANEWVRMDIQFECRNGISDNSGWSGLNSNQFRATIYRYFTDEYINANVFNFLADVDNINGIKYETGGSNGMEMYLHDSKCLNKSEQINNAELNFTSRIMLDDIKIKEIRDLEISYAFKTNLSHNINFRIYNFDNNEFDLIDSKAYDNSFNIEYFNKNGKGQSNQYINQTDNQTLNILLKVDGYSHSDNINFMIDYFMCKLTNETYEYNGIQSIRYYLEYWEVWQIGIIDLKLNFNETGLTRKLHHVLNDGYGYMGGSGFDVYSTENYDYNLGNITIENIETQLSVYCQEGHYTGSAFADKWMFTRIKIYINKEFFTSFDVNLYPWTLNTNFPYVMDYTYYHSNNSCYRIFEGIQGNWSMSNLRGIRNLYYEGFGTQHLFLKHFIDDLDIEIDEKQPYKKDEIQPENTEYWQYTSWTLSFDTYENHEIGNWSLSYPLLKAESSTGKYYYEIFEGKRLGDWGAFNWLRDFIAWIIKWLYLFVQMLFYLLIIAFNWIIVFVCAGVIGGFIWNIMIKYLLIGIMYVGWGFYLFFFKILIPFFRWFVYDALPVIIEFLVKVFAYILAFLIWLCTLCQGDFDQIYAQTYDILDKIADFLIDTISVLIHNIPAVFLYISMYVLLVFFCLFKHVYCKSKGYVNRSIQLNESFEAYMYPINFTKSTIKEVKELLGRWT